MEVSWKWRNEHGEGHWVVTNGVQTIHCDRNELKETIRELSEDPPPKP